ncbi:unnamed protein product, partial [Scytosiphon promiscuus]
LRDAGKALGVITHKLNEILQIADRISVLRQGRITGSGDPKTMTTKDLAEMMVGRPVSFDVTKQPFAPGKDLLKIENLTVLHENSEIAVNQINFSVRSGEIIGIAGVQGNGQTALVEALAGLRHITSGTVTYQDHDITHSSARSRHRIGIAHIPEDRQRTGIIPSFTVAENMVLDTYYDTRFSSRGQIKWDIVNEAAARGAGEFDVRTPSVF